MYLDISKSSKMWSFKAKRDFVVFSFCNRFPCTVWNRFFLKFCFWVQWFCTNLFKQAKYEVDCEFMQASLYKNQIILKQLVLKSKCFYFFVYIRRQNKIMWKVVTLPPLKPWPWLGDNFPQGQLSRHPLHDIKILETLLQVWEGLSMWLSMRFNCITFYKVFQNNFLKEIILLPFLS